MQEAVVLNLRKLLAAKRGQSEIVAESLLFHFGIFSEVVINSTKQSSCESDGTPSAWYLDEIQSRLNEIVKHRRDLDSLNSQGAALEYCLPLGVTTSVTLDNNPTIKAKNDPTNPRRNPRRHRA